MDYSYEEYKYVGDIEGYPKHLSSIEELPLPKRIIFYHNGMQYAFDYGSDEYKKIIELNNKRNESIELHITQEILNFGMDIDGLKKITDLLEYDYENYESVNFNLNFNYTYEVKIDEFPDPIKVENNTYWVDVGYSEDVFYQIFYQGLGSTKELLEYLYKIIE